MPRLKQLESLGNQQVFAFSFISSRPPCSLLDYYFSNLKSRLEALFTVSPELGGRLCINEAELDHIDFGGVGVHTLRLSHNVRPVQSDRSMVSNFRPSPRNLRSVRLCASSRNRLGRCD